MRSNGEIDYYRYCDISSRITFGCGNYLYLREPGRVQQEKWQEMSETRECNTCYWLIRTYDVCVGFCEEHEKLVRNDEEVCESYMAKGEK